MEELTKYEQFLGHLEHELESNDVIILRFKEIFKEELKPDIESLKNDK